MRDEHANISRRVGVVGFFTFLSRIAGLARDSVMAWAFGATKIADAFYVAFRIPNLLRRFVAEGALTVAFVPVYTAYLKKTRRDALEAASVVFTYLSLFLTLLVAAGIIFAPLIVKLIAYGFASDSQKFEMTVYLTRLMFPYIMLISLVALAMGILNSLKKFAAPAASPIFLNLAIIFGAVILSKLFDFPATGLALGVLIGGVLQLSLQIPSLAKEGMIPRINFNWRHKALKDVLLLMIPSAFGAAVYQINVLVVTLLASFLPEGSVSYLWYADRVSEFPLGIFAISVATAALPTLSDNVAEKDTQSFKETLNFSLRLAFLIAIPAMVGLFLLSGISINVLFQRGEFTAATSAATASALAIFALKIPFVSGVRNLVPGFFALRDAKTPVYVAAVTVVINAVFALMLMGRFLHLGLAAALVISSFFNFVILLYLMRRKIGLLGYKKLILSILKTSLASAMMGASIVLVERILGDWNLTSLLMKIVRLLLMMLAGTAVFIVITRIINRDDYMALIQMVKRRRNSKPVSS
ncbi:MAG TPA: murein biosynthesis integral membrane protein MurJ [bacterium]|nr:MAG: putative peptidoglycan biosynthesis protein MurJ [bacterium ADurb.Bin270]HPW45055.1 murein biosynthesis integral membrane protein MurJ [bacterium]HQC50808.1 murein biosynthesis integral membrane protein MurJ [bacterium]